MLSHWYNHDNFMKVKNLNSIPVQMNTQNYLKVPSMNSNLLIQQNQYNLSTSSINSTKGSTTNLRDNGSNFRVPWKIVILGDAGVGKSSLVKQFLNGCFSAIYNPTVEDSYHHNVNLPDGISQCIEILDTSGFYQFPAMRELNIRMGAAFILTFDLTKEETLNSLMTLRQEIVTIKSTENIPLILVGNKCDLSSSIKMDMDRKAKSIASEHFKCSYIESSAKENLNVNKIFNAIVDLIYKDMEEVKDTLNVSNTVNRRNSSISFVRRISISNMTKLNEQSRRFSEPACAEKNGSSGKPPKKTNSKSGSSKESSKEPSTPNSHKRKQKNCTIS